MNGALLRYADLLSALHAAGLESPEAEAIRVDMDDVWRDMTPDERDIARGIAAEMNKETR